MIKKVIISISLLIVFQLAVISAMFIKPAAVKHYAEKNNTIFRIRCTAYDPFNSLKGRYAQLNLNKDDIEKIEAHLDYKLKNVYKAANEYYLQEEYALTLDAMGRKNFNDLEPELEIYVGRDGTIVQKELYVHFNGAELPVEQYIKNYAN